MPSSVPRKRPAPLRTPSAVCCLRRDMIGSTASPFGFLSHEAAKFTLSHSARRLAPLAQGHTASAGLSTLRSDARISPRARSLLRGAPALTAAGPAPASLMQHRDRTVQVRFRSGRDMNGSITSGVHVSGSGKALGSRTSKRFRIMWTLGHSFDGSEAKTDAASARSSTQVPARTSVAS